MFHKTIKQRGDTMIEVLLAMAVVGLSLGIAYGIANRAIATGRNAQERSEATKVAESQIEILKSITASQSVPSDIDSEEYCVSSASGWAKVIPDAPPNPADPATASECTEINGSFYDAKVEYISGTPDVYRAVVTWIVPGSNEPGRVELVYRP